jgi:hypothetical protein
MHLAALMFAAVLIAGAGPSAIAAQAPARNPAEAADAPLTNTIRSTDALCEKIDESYSVLDSATDLMMAVGKYKAQSAFAKFTGQRADSESAALKRVSRESIWLPVAAEEMFGNQQHKARVDAGFVVERKQNRQAIELYRRADQLLANLTPLVPESVPYKLQIHVLTDADVQAEALPGGHVYITRGALKQNDGVVLLMLAHEIAHITKRHQTKALQARLVDTGLTFEEAKRLMTDRAAAPKIIAGAVQKMRGRFAEYDQGQELQSDACAMRLLTEISGVKPLEAVQRYLATQKDTGKQEQTREDIVYASHPQYPDRERRYREAYAYHSQQQTAVGSASTQPISRSTGATASSFAASQGTEQSPEASGEVTSSAGRVVDTVKGWAGSVGDRLRSFGSRISAGEPNTAQEPQ